MLAAPAPGGRECPQEQPRPGKAPVFPDRLYSFALHSPAILFEFFQWQGNERQRNENESRHWNNSSKALADLFPPCGRPALLYPAGQRLLFGPSRIDSIESILNKALAVNIPHSVARRCAATRPCQPRAMVLIKML